MAKELDCGIKRNESDDSSDLKEETEKLVISAQIPPKNYQKDISFALKDLLVLFDKIPIRNQRGRDPRPAATT